jgi:small-conductance mechanosensitive channel
MMQSAVSLVPLSLPPSRKGASPNAAATLRSARHQYLSLSVTIGYNVPWRQVHALLLLGASRTAGIRNNPPPRVLQRELSDFYVQYHLIAHLLEGKNRAEVISELHAQIQDAFNEFGAQIMSPHFESQPETKLFVPKREWHAGPAAPPPISDEVSRKPTSGSDSWPQGG